MVKAYRTFNQIRMYIKIVRNEKSLLKGQDQGFISSFLILSYFTLLLNERYDVRSLIRRMLIFIYGHKNSPVRKPTINADKITDNLIMYPEFGKICSADDNKSCGSTISSVISLCS
jgi:hypothetical protein